MCSTTLSCRLVVLVRAPVSGLAHPRGPLNARPIGTPAPAIAALRLPASSQLLCHVRVSNAALHSAPGRDPQPPKIPNPLLDKSNAQRGSDPQQGTDEEPLQSDVLGTKGSQQPPPEESDPLQDRSMGLISRFKKTFKQYGKVMIPVHLVTSAVWFGSFYYAATRGVNVLPMLEALGLPEKLLKLLYTSQGGNVLTAYALYKIATPARYTVTLGCTSYSVKYLRKRGILNTPPSPNVKQFLQDKMDETREKISEKVSDTREKISEKVSDTREKISEKVSDTREKISEKVSDTREKISEKVQDTKNRVTGKK